MRHKCPRNDCNELLPHQTLACRAHWFAVAAPTRARVMDTWKRYSRSGSMEHFPAYLAARNAFEAEVNA